MRCGLESWRSTFKKFLFKRSETLVDGKYEEDEALGTPLLKLLESIACTLMLPASFFNDFLKLLRKFTWEIISLLHLIFIKLLKRFIKVLAAFLST